jgi:hypothetical protein
MAVLQQPVNNSNPFGDVIGDDLAPAGTYVATVLDIKDEFGIQRQKYQSMEMETVDLTTFLFGFRDAQGTAHRVASKRMKISGNEKSTLFGFLKGMLGHAPQYGWDYCTLKGKQCLLTVEHIQRRDGSGVFAAIASLSPVPAGMGVGEGLQTIDHGPQTGTGSVNHGAHGGSMAARPMAPSPAPAVPAGTAAAPSSGDDPIPF